MKIQKFILGNMGTNCYFLTGADPSKCVIVDPADDAPHILAKLAERALRLDYIILTHGHFDHMLALDELRRVTGAPLCIHELDNEMLLNPNKSLMFYAGITHPQKSAERLFHDSDLLDVGGEALTVMHAPGHTPGSCCFIADGIMLSGDTLFREGTGRYDLPGGDYPSLRASLRRIAELEGEYRIFPGHGPQTTLSHEKENNIALI